MPDRTEPANDVGCPQLHLEIAWLLLKHRELWQRVHLAMHHIDPQLPIWPRPKSTREWRSQVDELCDMVSEICRQAGWLHREAERFIPEHLRKS